MKRALCLHCGEPVAATDRAERRAVVHESKPPEVRLLHWECAARQIVGSVGHLLGKCSCHGGNEEDPPHLSPRQAAKAALELASRQAKG